MNKTKALKWRQHLMFFLPIKEAIVLITHIFCKRHKREYYDMNEQG